MQGFVKNAEVETQNLKSEADARQAAYQEQSKKLVHLMRLIEVTKCRSQPIASAEIELKNRLERCNAKCIQLKGGLDTVKAEWIQQKEPAINVGQLKDEDVTTIFNVSHVVNRYSSMSSSGIGW
jgi:hypothetical protein